MNEVIYISEATAARRRVKLSLAVDATDGLTAETSTTVTEAAAQLSANGAAAVASTNNIVFIDDTDMPGAAYVELTSAELTSLGVGNHRAYFKSSEVAVMMADFSIVPDDPWTSAPSAADIADAVDAALSDNFEAVPTTTENASAVRTELATELGLITTNLDAAISTLLTAADYTAPPSAASISTQVQSDLADDFAAIPTTAEIASAIEAIVIETGVTLKQAIAIVSAAVAGNLSGGGTATEVIRAINNGATTRISAAVDSSGNRTLTLTLP